MLMDPHRSQEPEESPADGGSVLTLLDTVGLALEAPASKSTPPASSVSVQVIPKAPITEDTAPASHDSTLCAAGAASDALELEILTPTITPIAISEILPTRPPKLENPLKKKRSTTRRYDLSLRLGGRRRGDREHDQVEKLAIGKFAATRIKEMGEEWLFSLPCKSVRQIPPELFTPWSDGGPVNRWGLEVGDCGWPEKARECRMTRTLLSPIFAKIFDFQLLALHSEWGRVTLLY